jgi:hypothetical protein
VARIKPTDDQWRVYYDRADELRAVIGDPYRRHIEQRTLRERAMLLGSSLFFAGLVSVFYLLTSP